MRAFLLDDFKRSGGFFDIAYHSSRGTLGRGGVRPSAIEGALDNGERSASGEVKLGALGSVASAGGQEKGPPSTGARHTTQVGGLQGSVSEHVGIFPSRMESNVSKRYRKGRNFNRLKAAMGSK